MKKKKINKYQIIFLDFDGTLKLSDRIKGILFYQIFKNKVNVEIKKKILLHHYANLGMSRYKKIPIYMKFCNLKINSENKKKYIKKYDELVFVKVCNSPWVKGAKKFLKKNKEKKLILLTATPHNEIVKITKKIGIYDFFYKIYGYPHKKNKILKKIILKLKLKITKYLYIGNSYSDYLAAFENKVRYLNIGKLVIKNKKIENIINFNFIN